MLPPTVSTITELTNTPLPSFLLCSFIKKSRIQNVSRSFEWQVTFSMFVWARATVLMILFFTCCLSMPWFWSVESLCPNFCQLSHLDHWHSDFWETWSTLSWPCITIKSSNLNVHGKHLWIYHYHMSSSSCYLSAMPTHSNWSECLLLNIQWLLSTKMLTGNSIFSLNTPGYPLLFKKEGSLLNDVLA